MGAVPDIVGYINAQLSQYTYTFPRAPKVSHTSRWNYVWCLELSTVYRTERSGHAFEALSQRTDHYGYPRTLFQWRLGILCLPFQVSVPNTSRKLWSSNAHGRFSVHCSMSALLLVICLLNILAVCHASWVEDRSTGGCGVLYDWLSWCILWPYWYFDPHQGSTWKCVSHDDGQHIYEGEVRMSLL